MKTLLHKETSIATHIYLIRGEQVMLDFDLAQLYGVETRVLKQSVKRNLDRFPDDFIFELTEVEWNNLRSQIVTSSWGGIRYQPFAFTEQGVAMLSGVLKSEQAVAVNIAIMRTFVQLRKLMNGNKELARKIKSLEQKYDEQFQMVFEAIRQLIAEEEKPRKRIGYRQN